MRAKQRLVLCLDGTWNNRDDSTNVLHHFALTLNGEPPGALGAIKQLKYYHEGVGTGVLDGITGGGFGFGLEENVRDAYDWLVENYSEGTAPAEADEIYIFGFSRGAYTARSLIGFIATYGLLRRGAPISVNGLWDQYCILGREREQHTCFWDTVFGKTPTRTRRINDLICDPWKIERCERRRAEAVEKGSSSCPSNGDRLPGQLAEDLNDSERLLVRWSRRIRITYLGVYDTVGAVGLEALAIPGLTSKLAMHHNMRATTLVQHCRHALALDEHRSSFSHTPFLEYVGHDDDEDDNQRLALRAGDPQVYWRRVHAMWCRKIEQRWFVGAHSNIGGGYSDNELALLPLKWLLEGAEELKLACEPLTAEPPSKRPALRDSYAEFVKPFWTMVLRSKRCYRPIDPARELRARRSDEENRQNAPAGFSLQSINEQIDRSVYDRVRNDVDYCPPNLWEYAQRKSKESRDPAETAALTAIADRKPRHPWLGESMSAHTALVLCRRVQQWVFSLRTGSSRLT